MFNSEITVGNLVAVVAAAISAAAVIATLSKERALRKKELADRVRQSASLVAAKLDRWKQLALQTFDQLQAAATDADGHLVASNDEIQTRDQFWKQVVSAQASLAKAVLDEEIEVAYSNLFGYDPKVHSLFTMAVSRLRQVESLVFLQLLNRTQHEILTVRRSAEQRLLSAQLGNRLRYCLAESRHLLEAHMESVIQSFRTAMSTLVSASDDALVNRTIAIPSPDSLPAPELLLSAIYSVPSDDARSCKRILADTRLSELGSTMFEPWPLGVEFPEEELPTTLRRKEA
jgi:hypothetical protein